MLPPPPTSTLFPYTTLFRSEIVHLLAGVPREIHAGRAERRVRRGALQDRLLRRRAEEGGLAEPQDRKSTRLNSSHGYISYAVFCLKKKKKKNNNNYI